ncbi:MAG: hypothetical protein WAT92_13185 [Saprospiraceae bacterium]
MNEANITLYHEDGRIRKVGSSWKYDYYIKDHLDNLAVATKEQTKPKAWLCSEGTAELPHRSVEHAFVTI